MYESYLERMRGAQSAAERSAIIAEMCRMFAFSSAKAYKVLSQNGWESGRKKRTDAGKSAIESSTVKLAAAMIKHGIRKNGKSTVPVTVARSVLIQNGYDVPLSSSRLRGLLAQAVLTADDMKKASAHQPMRTEHPNQVHQCDPSVSLLYFAPGGLCRILRDDEQYKNKDFLKDKLKCWRYVLSDHYSSSICVRYYAAMGETAENMYDFLLYAWGQKKDHLYGFHGLPETLVWDCGSANISKSVTKALAALRVKTIPHLPGNPRAKGQVEVSNNIVETHFECLLKMESVSSVEQLNEAAERWCAAYNANMIEGFDSRLTRMGRKIGARLDLWNRIKTEQLREVPDSDVCRQIFTTGIQVRKVGGDLTVSLVHPKAKQSLRYSVSGLAGIRVGMEVMLQPVLVDKDALVGVSYEYEGNITSCELSPIPYDDAGFDLSAPVFGKAYKSQIDTVREANVKELAAGSGANKAVPFASVTGGLGLKTHSLIQPQNRFATHMTGDQVTVENVQISEVFVSHIEAAKRFKARTGFLPDGFIAQLKKQYPEAVPLKDIDDLALLETSGARVSANIA